jgi:hypothetical protein
VMLVCQSAVRPRFSKCPLCLVTSPSQPCACSTVDSWVHHGWQHRVITRKPYQITSTLRWRALAKPTLSSAHLLAPPRMWPTSFGEYSPNSASCAVSSTPVRLRIAHVKPSSLNTSHYASVNVLFCKKADSVVYHRSRLATRHY